MLTNDKHKQIHTAQKSAAVRVISVKETVWWSLLYIS